MSLLLVSYLSWPIGMKPSDSVPLGFMGSSSPYSSPHGAVLVLVSCFVADFVKLRSIIPFRLRFLSR